MTLQKAGVGVVIASGILLLHASPASAQFTSGIEGTVIDGQACHDRHTPLVRDARAYDARCTTCHTPPAAGVTHTPRVCVVATENCTTCHMPKYDVPDMPFEFTDRMIRIVRKAGRDAAAGTCDVLPCGIQVAPQYSGRVGHPGS